MKNLLKTLTMIAAMFAAAPAARAGDAPDVVPSVWSLQVSAQQFTTARTTGCIPIAGGKFLYTRGEVTRGGNLAAMKVSCQSYRDSACAGVPAPMLSCSGNTCSLYEPTSPTVAADYAHRARFDAAGDDYAKCTWTNVTGGQAADVLNGYVRTTKE